MSLSILTNITAMQTHQNLLNASNQVSKSMARLSSGLRINNAADDAAGYAISQGLTAQVNGLDQAGRNVGDAVSMVQTAESSMNNIQNMLQRVRELAVQYTNGSLQSSDKAAIQNEVDQLTNEVDRQRGAIAFNGNHLLDGTANGSQAVTYQVGANATDTLTASFADIRSSLSAANGFTWANVNSSTAHVIDLTALGSNALSSIDTAIKGISTQASTLGAVQNRLQYTSDAIQATETNLASSNSRIKDVDMANEMTKMTQSQILQQAATSMLAQANSAPQMVLKLLG